MTEFSEVPSPFCGIGTDDLIVQVDGLALKVSQNGCGVNTPAFEQAITDTSPRVKGRKADLHEAAGKAAELLKASNQPVIGGCATDVNGMRALLSLADRTGAVVDQVNFNAARNNFLAMQNAGWMNTTLAEVKNRCDLLLVIGTDIELFSPRFFERYIWNSESMFVEDTGRREVIYLGKSPSGDASTSPEGLKPRVFPCAGEDLPAVVSVMRALLLKHRVSLASVGGIAVSDLQEIVDKLQQASYGVVTWAAGALDFSNADLTVQTICSIVKDLNKKTRCSGLPLGGREGDLTANQVCGWITGYPARVRFSRGFPEYDPYLYDSESMLKNGEADVLVWVQSMNAASVPPVADAPTVVVGRSGMVFEQEPDVFIPVGTPGIDHVGHAFRMDNVVAIRLKKLRDSGLPSVAEVLSAIERAL
ncbi:MAG: formylmethanofuran dehydrogenase subunit B [Gammaproteobacteria bacterium]